MLVRIILFILLCVVASLTGCYSPQVSQDYHIGQNFSTYRTYSWRSNVSPTSQDVRVNSPLMAERFQHAIDGTLARRGFFQAANGDMVVSYTYTARTKIESYPSYYGPAFGVGYGRYSSGDYVGVSTRFGSDIREYDVGVLVIDITDGRTGAPLWRGTGTEMVRTHWTPEDLTSFAYRLVDSVLSQFPPQ